ncbi:hypothetical protein CPB83DRAFT_548152 [Crepidotus variabilis]|uniref:Uncharacterized protein n=1 Tax=Crepidotus variabilis TaxID=179855 RepID=A0A9P6EAB2_9AGAR|nr:hypothetical protein CPB83DRAFT_548152 [Crepidotus variabilis]
MCCEAGVCRPDNNDICAACHTGIVRWLLDLQKEATSVVALLKAVDTLEGYSAALATNFCESGCRAPECFLLPKITAACKDGIQAMQQFTDFLGKQEG